MRLRRPYLAAAVSVAVFAACTLDPLNPQPLPPKDEITPGDAGYFASPDASRSGNPSAAPDAPADAGPGKNPDGTPSDGATGAIPNGADAGDAGDGGDADAVDADRPDAH